MTRCFTAALLSAALAQPAELPVRAVTLYKHGVGFFEREGALGPAESARLDFNASEMNDVLKSLTIRERGGEKISGLRYDSMDPLSHKLAEFPFQIGQGQPLSGTLNQLKGARVELKFGSETVAGVIVNARLQGAGDKQPERELLTLLLESGELRTVDLSAATGVRFTDPELQREFKEYFEALSAARSKEKRSVYIDSTDAKQREVVASYMIPAPVWKSSYRLIFTADGKPMLEGWAIVDNTTGEDWNKVTLSLASGRPISFVSQLYAPKYLDRPQAELPDDGAARPVVHQGVYAATGALAGAVAGIGGVDGFARKSQSAPPRPQAAAPSAGLSGETLQSRAAGDAVAPSSIIAGASGGELGELFEYRISQPVTIRKNESAMLPFLQQPITARKLLIYSHTGSEHPTNAVELTNTSGETLDGGPVTVYDGGAYGGEALMETLKTGDKRLISYAVDLGTRVTEAFGSRGSNLTPDVLLGYIRNGNLADAGKRQLQRIADQETQITENDRAIHDAEAQIRDLTNDEDRIRRNIESLNSVSGQQQQVQNYARQLDSHEQQLAALRDRQADLQKKKAALQAELDRLIDALTF
jgi:hypothetical protein